MRPASSRRYAAAHARARLSFVLSPHVLSAQHDSKTFSIDILSTMVVPYIAQRGGIQVMSQTREG